MNTQGRGARIVMILIIVALAFSFVVGAIMMPQ
jgi:type II secretory pathway component PulK